MTPPKIPTLREYFEATKPKRKTGVDPVKSAKIKAGIAASLRKAQQFQRMCAATVGPRAIPAPVLEHQVRTDRKHRADLCWIEQRVILEIEGGTHVGGRHNFEKANLAACAGYRILYVTPSQLLKPETLQLVIDAIHGRKNAED